MQQYDPITVDVINGIQSLYPEMGIGKRVGSNILYVCPICAHAGRDKGKNNLSFSESKGFLTCFADRSHSCQLLADYRRNLNDDKKSLNLKNADRRSVETLEIYHRRCSKYALNQKDSIDSLMSARGLTEITIRDNLLGIDPDYFKGESWTIPCRSLKSGEIFGTEYRKVDWSSYEYNGTSCKISRRSGTVSDLCAINNPKNPKHIVIMEGFMDGFAMYEYLCMQESVNIDEWQVSTPSCGVSTICKLMKELKFENYQNIYLCIDNDEAANNELSRIKTEIGYEFYHVIVPGNNKDFGDWFNSPDTNVFTENIFKNTVIYNPKTKRFKKLREVGTDPLREYYKQRSVNKYAKTGFKNLDAIFTDLHTQTYDMIMLAAKPGVGKTAFALNMALNLAKSGIGVAFYSIEMPAIKIMQRLVTIEFRNKLLYAKQNIDNLTRIDNFLKDADASVRKLPICICDKDSDMTVDEMLAFYKAEITKDDNIGFLMIDHFNKVIPSSKSYNRFDREVDSSNELLNMAKQLNIPTMVLHHLRKDEATRYFKKKNTIPTQDDIKGAGTLTANATRIIILSKNETDDESDNSKYPGNIMKSSDGKKKIDLTIVKNRDGQSDTTFTLQWECEFFRFTDIAK